MPSQQTMLSPKQQFLNTLDREHATTVKVLRAYPPEKADLKPHEKLKSAKDLAFIFVLERGLASYILNNRFNELGSDPMPAPPATLGEVIDAYEAANRQFRAMVEGFTDEQMMEKVTFLVGPKTPGEFTRLEFCWFLLSDEIHHRGQFSIYVRLADAKLPSIYGPTADEPWM